MGQYSILNLKGHLLNFRHINFFPNQTFASNSLVMKDFENVYDGCLFLLEVSLILLVCTIVAAAAAAAATAAADGLSSI